MDRGQATWQALRSSAIGFSRGWRYDRIECFYIVK
jgi:hypothetical protein